MQRLKKKSVDSIERFSIRATHWVGSTNSLLVHTALFMVAFTLYFLNVELNKILLVLTTVVSLEAIYLSIFIQMSVNRQARRLREVARDVEEISEDIEGIEKDVDEIQKDVEEIEEDDAEDKARDDIMLQKIESALAKVSEELAELKKNQK